MARLTGWWDRRSDPARIELYTRWSFHFFALMEIGLLVGLTTGSSAPAGAKAALYGLAAVHCALCAVVSAKALDWLLDRGGRPVRLPSAVGALTFAAVLTALSFRAAGLFADDADATLMVIGFSAFGFGAAVLCLRGTRTMLCVLAGAAATVGALTALFGQPAHQALVNALFVCVAGGGWGLTAGFSAWLLGAVWELDAARELQARLAVAEERLRFGRDLHDVMGRNLAVIALKSELAVQLARRGRPEAVEQMAEVQRIARESQREVRDVVRGYRAADLAVELAGALSVLRAAGVESRAEVEHAGTLPAGVQAAFGWVIREATTNVLRHSDARHCAIRLTADPSRAAVLAVTNDGVPTPPPAPARTPGSGLPGLTERLAALGGTLTTRTAGATFHLTARIPLGEGEGEGEDAGAGADGITDPDIATDAAAEPAAEPTSAAEPAVEPVAAVRPQAAASVAAPGAEPAAREARPARKGTARP